MDVRAIADFSMVEDGAAVASGSQGVVAMCLPSSMYKASALVVT